MGRPRKQRPPTPEEEKIFLKVPYADKDLAKTAGAQWDKHKRSWFCTGSQDQLRGCQDWLPENEQRPKNKKIKQEEAQNRQLDEGTISIYTDGSCTANHRKTNIETAAGWGAIVIIGSRCENEEQ